MHDPRTGHMEVVHRILRYLKGILGRGIWFRKNGHLNLVGYYDADWASSRDDRRSTSDYCVFVGGNLVSWRSKKQAFVACSTAEAEYRAMTLGLCEMLWLRLVEGVATVCFIVITLQQLILQIIPFSWTALSMWRLIDSSSRRSLIVGFSS
jgi:hypothetical protein